MCIRDRCMWQVLLGVKNVICSRRIHKYLIYEVKWSEEYPLTGADSGFYVTGTNSAEVVGFWRVFSIIEAFLAATLKHFKDVINLIQTIILLKNKIKIVNQTQMGKDNSLVERQTFSSEFHLPKRRSIYGFGTPPLSLSLCPSFKRGRTSLSPPSGSATV